MSSGRIKTVDVNVPPLEQLVEGFTTKQRDPIPTNPNVIDALAETHGFPSRQPRRASPKVPADSSVSVVGSYTRRKRPNLRTRALFIKITDEAADQLHAIAKEDDIPLSRAVEAAIAALVEKRLNKKNGQ